MTRRRGNLATFAAVLGLGVIICDPAVARGAKPPEDANCPRQDKGFVWVEELKTCFNPAGYVWAEGYSNSYSNYPASATDTYGIATLGLTLTTTSNLNVGGPLKTAFDVRFQYRGAEPWSDGPSEFQVEPQTLIAKWAGVTVGYRDSFFDFYANANVEGTDPATIGADTNLPLLAYTASMPDGLFATFSVEQGKYRDGGIDSAASSLASFRQDSSTPDFVGVVGQTTAWGNYQLSGALHRIEIDGAAATGGSSPSTWGYALQVGAMINLPMIAENDSLYLQSAYVSGAITYLGLINPSDDFSPPDAYYSTADGFSSVSGWNVTAQYLHNWTETLSSAVFGGYARFSVDDALAEATYGGSGADNVNVGANIVWSPLSKASFVIQYGYNNYSVREYSASKNSMPQSSQDAHQLLLMAQYSF